MPAEWDSRDTRYDDCRDHDTGSRIWWSLVQEDDHGLTLTGDAACNAGQGVWGSRGLDE